MGLGEEVKTGAGLLYQLRKGSPSRDAGSQLWSCCWGKKGGEKKRKAKGMKGGKAGGKISGLVVLKASLNVNLSPKPGDACVYIEAGGCAVGAPPAPPLPRAHKAGGVVRGRRPERVSARRRPPRPGRPPPAPAARDPLVAAAGSNSVHLLPPLPSLRRLTEPGTYRRTR